MCSNRSSTNGAGVSGDGGGDYATHILKKPKRQRVPKRGPGVAELEKILREQETQVISSDKGNFSFVTDHHNNVNHLISPHPPPPPPPSLPMTMPYGNGGGGKRSTFSGGSGDGGSNGVRISGSGISSHEEAPLPAVWNSCESSIYEEAPNNKMPSGYPIISTSSINGSDQMHMLQKKQYSHQYPSPNINLFQQYGPLPSPEKQPAAGFHVHLEEPPSNQRSSYHNYSYMLPEEEKMVGTKRARTFTMESTSGSGAAPPKFHFQASSPPFAHMHTLHQSPSFSNHTTNTGFHSRGDYGAVDGNFLIFGSTVTPSLLMTQNFQHELSQHPSSHFQESSSMKGSHSRHSQQEKKPFNSLLIPEEQTRIEEETTLSLNTERPRRDETIDLNLKL